VTAATREVLVELLRRSATGDRRAFRELYRATSAKLFGVAIRILRRQELAEEAVQEAFVQAWRMSGSYEASAGSPITWLASIVRNRSIDILRRADEKLVHRRIAADDEGDALERIADPAADPETAEGMRQLRRCLDGLGEENGRMVLLAYHQGWSREDLAERFSRPVATVKTILRRSLAQLKACMDG
jgi:RNA polymerase sigma-70 factor (ECF subfamily)